MRLPRIRTMCLLSALVLFTLAVCADWKFHIGQLHEGGYIGGGLLAFAASFMPWRD